MLWIRELPFIQQFSDLQRRAPRDVECEYFAHDFSLIFVNLQLPIFTDFVPEWGSAALPFAQSRFSIVASHSPLNKGVGFKFTCAGKHGTKKPARWADIAQMRLGNRNQLDPMTLDFLSHGQLYMCLSG